MVAVRPHPLPHQLRARQPVEHRLARRIEDALEQHVALARRGDLEGSGILHLGPPAQIFFARAASWSAHWPQPSWKPIFTWASQSSSVQWRATAVRSEEHTSELQSLMRISYAVFCLQKK